MHARVEEIEREIAAIRRALAAATDAVSRGDARSLAEVNPDVQPLVDAVVLRVLSDRDARLAANALAIAAGEFGAVKIPDVIDLWDEEYRALALRLWPANRRAESDLPRCEHGVAPAHLDGRRASECWKCEVAAMTVRAESAEKERDYLRQYRADCEELQKEIERLRKERDTLRLQHIADVEQIERLRAKDPLPVAAFPVPRDVTLNSDPAYATKVDVTTVDDRLCDVVRQVTLLGRRIDAVEEAQRLALDRVIEMGAETSELLREMSSRITLLYGFRSDTNCTLDHVFTRLSALEQDVRGLIAHDVFPAQAHLSVPPCRCGHPAADHLSGVGSCWVCANLSTYRLDAVKCEKYEVRP